MKGRNRILVSRTDRLGDVMMAVPTLDYLREALPDTPIDFLCRPEFLELLAPFLSLRKIGGLSSLEGEIGWSHYRAVLLLFPERPLCFAAWKGRVPIRVGPLSRPWTFLLLNRGLRQKRSEGARPEGEYNLRLARNLVKALEGKNCPASEPRLVLDEGASEARGASGKLSRLGIGEGSAFLVLHPGMGGSGTNAKASDYIAILRSIVGQAIPFVVTKGPCPLDGEILAEIARELPSLPILDGLSLAELREVFRRARLVVGPSTGPLHLAHLCGAATLGLYSRVAPQKKERWAPWGGRGKVRILEMEEGNLPERAASALKELWGT